MAILSKNSFFVSLNGHFNLWAFLHEPGKHLR
jgi:hypothetical protein